MEEQHNTLQADISAADVCEAIGIDELASRLDVGAPAIRLAVRNNKFAARHLPMIRALWREQERKWHESYDWTLFAVTAPAQKSPDQRELVR